MRPYSTQTRQRGLNGGEHACAAALVQQRGCYDGAPVLGTEEQPCTLPEPCGDEFSVNAGPGLAQLGSARPSEGTHDYLMAAARASLHPPAPTLLLGVSGQSEAKASSADEDG